MNIVDVPQNSKRNIMTSFIRETAALISVTAFIASIGVLAEVVRQLV